MNKRRKVIYVPWPSGRSCERNSKIDRQPKARDSQDCFSRTQPDTHRKWIKEGHWRASKTAEAERTALWVSTHLQTAHTGKETWMKCHRSQKCCTFEIRIELVPGARGAVCSARPFGDSHGRICPSSVLNKPNCSVAEVSAARQNVQPTAKYRIYPHGLFTISLTLIYTQPAWLHTTPAD